MAPQRLENIESAPGNGMGSETSNPLNLAHGRAADPRAPAESREFLHQRHPIRVGLTKGEAARELQSCKVDRKRRLVL